MKRGNRVERRDVWTIDLLTCRITLGERQYFCQTERAWELWETIEGRPYMLKRWPRARVFWVGISEEATV